VSRKAAIELQRYLYTLTGQYPPLNTIDAQYAMSPDADHAGVHFILATQESYAKQRHFLQRLQHLPLPLPGSDLNHHLVHPDSHVLHVANIGSTSYVLLYASNPTAVHHAVFSFLEHCGMRFRIAEDVVPDQLRQRFTIATLIKHVGGKFSWPKTLTPRMSERGLQPFHDFSAGPDWWNQQVRITL
jgi:hypothetical protein